MNWLYLVIHEIAIALKSHLSSAPLTVGGTASKAACLDVRIAPPHTHTHSDTVGETPAQG